jgi:NADH-ubiquinone oxidoreductase chain 5
MTDIEFLNIGYKILPLVVTIFGCVTAYFLYSLKLKEYYNFKKTSLAKIIFNFFNKKWYFDRIYNQFVVQKVLQHSYSYFYQDVDRGLVEKVGPFGLSNVILNFSNKLKVSQTGFMLHYLGYFFVSIFFFIVLLSKDMTLFFFLLVLSVFFNSHKK